MANSVDSDQTAPIGAVCSRSTLFASIFNSLVMLGNYLHQTTSAHNIFRCIFFLGALRAKSVCASIHESGTNSRHIRYGFYTLVLVWRWFHQCCYLEDVIFSNCSYRRGDTIFTNGPRYEKTCLRWLANNTGADQPAHPRSLISAFVIRILERTISKLATSEISFF